MQKLANGDTVDFERKVVGLTPRFKRIPCWHSHKGGLAQSGERRFRGGPMALEEVPSGMSGREGVQREGGSFKGTLCISGSLLTKASSPQKNVVLAPC